jgi:hypothetical protein
MIMATVPPTAAALLEAVKGYGRRAPIRRG